MRISLNSSFSRVLYVVSSAIKKPQHVKHIVMLQFVAVKPCCAFLGTGLIPGVCRLCLHMFLAQINVRASPASVSCRALAPFTSISSTSVLNSVLRCQSITVSHHYCLVASLIHNSFVRCV